MPTFQKHRSDPDTCSPGFVSCAQFQYLFFIKQPAHAEPVTVDRFASMRAEILDQAFELAVAISQVCDVKVWPVSAQMRGYFRWNLLCRKAIGFQPLLTFPIEFAGFGKRDIHMRIICSTTVDATINDKMVLGLRTNLQRHTLSHEIEFACLFLYLDNFTAFNLTIKAWKGGKLLVSYSGGTWTPCGRLPIPFSDNAIRKPSPARREAI